MRRQDAVIRGMLTRERWQFYCRLRQAFRQNNNGHAEQQLLILSSFTPSCRSPLPSNYISPFFSLFTSFSHFPGPTYLPPTGPPSPFPSSFSNPARTDHKLKTLWSSDWVDTRIAETYVHVGPIILPVGQCGCTAGKFQVRSLWLEKISWKNDCNHYTKRRLNIYEFIFNLPVSCVHVSPETRDGTCRIGCRPTVGENESELTTYRTPLTPIYRRWSCEKKNDHLHETSSTRYLAIIISATYMVAGERTTLRVILASPRSLRSPCHSSSRRLRFVRGRAKGGNRLEINYWAI